MFRATFVRILNEGKLLAQLGVIRQARRNPTFVAENIDLLLSLLKHHSPMIRAEAELCLGFSAQSSVAIVERLLRELDTGDSQHRCYMAHALGYLGLTREIDTGEPVPHEMHLTVGNRLADMLTTDADDPDIVFRVLQSLARLQHPNWRTVLANYRDDIRKANLAPYDTVQEEVRYLLGERE